MHIHDIGSNQFDDVGKIARPVVAGGAQLVAGVGAVERRFVLIHIAAIRGQSIGQKTLVSAAAQTWEVDASTLRAEAGRVVDGSGSRSATYGELVEAAMQQDVPEDPAIKERSEFEVVGKPVRRIDGPVKVTGLGPFDGLILQEIGPALRARLGLSSDREGVIVLALDSARQARNVQPGDIILEINGTAIETMDDFKAVTEAAAADGRRTWKVVLNRRGGLVYLTWRG